MTAALSPLGSIFERPFQSWPRRRDFRDPIAKNEVRSFSALPLPLAECHVK
jgi:hypothetical protein